VASGLVDDIDSSDLAALDPLPQQFSEAEYLCRTGDKADRLWVVVGGSVAIRNASQTLYVRQANEVIGEQNLLSNEDFRSFDLVADESHVETLLILKERIQKHPRADLLWRNIAKIISLKLKLATAQTMSLLEQLKDDAHILKAYTNEYALSRRRLSGGEYITDHRGDRAIIWFSDIVDFSQYSLALTPVRTADLVQRFFTAQSEAVHRYGGHIDKFIGDGMMAFWVLSPDESESDSVACNNAVFAAEEAASAVAEISVGPKPLELRIGLHVGLVLSGDFGSATRHQFTLVGSEVNKAARLEQVHGEDIIEGEDAVGAIRLSEEFHKELPENIRKKYGRMSVAKGKNIGDVRIFS
jgi:class 3 adenylate cyclase